MKLKRTAGALALGVLVSLAPAAGAQAAPAGTKRTFTIGKCSAGGITWLSTVTLYQEAGGVAKFYTDVTRSIYPDPAPAYPDLTEPGSRAIDIHRRSDGAQLAYHNQSLRGQYRPSPGDWAVGSWSSGYGPSGQQVRTAGGYNVHVRTTFLSRSCTVGALLPSVL